MQDRDLQRLLEHSEGWTTNGSIITGPAIIDVQPATGRWFVIMDGISIHGLPSRPAAVTAFLRISEKL